MNAKEALEIPSVRARLARNAPTKPSKLVAIARELARRARMLDAYVAFGATDSVARDLYPKPRRDSDG